MVMTEKNIIQIRAMLGIVVLLLLNVDMGAGPFCLRLIDLRRFLYLRYQIWPAPPEST